ncbi:cytochrome P450 [Coprinopsis cinerea okayama7|uniref:Cytochrome P450 n=1 Tax=Coprinopsis cinerea (strain Okayama-7 / 130 / ATCC MYA-4618 / FGSC 9003) TaxID=240176 RepID=A8NNF5_COPC7|nr:cytochrome P450 [Coprinopsis cinerea okayama7\|eukprot:XP_001835122.1 cytochrome P450 [Coprinopsis cinerea okayama7\
MTLSLPSEVLLYLVVPVLSAAIYWSRQRSHASRSLPLPPGPKKWPLVGNLFHIPTTFEWETYAHWSEVYNSDILHLDVAGKSIIIVNSQKVATELFEKRSALYSSRARFVMVNELIGFDWLFGFMPYGEGWKERRRLFQQHFHPLNTSSHQPIELEFTQKMLQQLLQTPHDFMSHIRHMVGAITITMAYGLDIRPSNDPYIEIAEQALIGLAAGAAPGAFLVDSLPFLKHVPAWFPGADFKRKAAEWRSWTRKMVEVPFRDAQKAINSGKAIPSFTSMCLGGLDESKDNTHKKKVIQETAATFFVGGSDTTVSSLNTFILAMTCYPEVQAKAQKELDRVLGPNALPDFGDEESLPYISAIVKEVLRWQTVTPLAIPHYLTEDDEYNGYFLPKGSVVVGNAWAMLHDKDEYNQPLVFQPERFLTPDGSKLDPNVREPTAAFGFGRRICPGKHMATSMLYIAIASILTVFEISKAVDEDGNVIEPTRDYVSSMVSHPEPFKCSIKPRSKAAEALVLSLG